MTEVHKKTARGETERTLFQEEIRESPRASCLMGTYCTARRKQPWKGYCDGLKRTPKHSKWDPIWVGSMRRY